MRQLWSTSEMELLAKMYPSHPTKDVARLLNREITKVYSKAKREGLAKNAEFLDSDASGRLRKGQSRPGTEHTRFPKGHVPANKGLRRPGYAPGRMKETQFKKGERSGVAALNWCQIGTIRTDGEGYQRIKVREAVAGEATGFGNTKAWPLLNRYVWEQHHGPIPPKHLVIFKDKNRANCSIENLELLSMPANAERNRMWNSLPRELAAAIQLNGVLKRKVRTAINGKKQT